MHRRWLIASTFALACGPVVGDADDGTSTGVVSTSIGSDPVSVTANSTLPPQSEVSSLEGSYDAVSWEEGGSWDIGLTSSNDTIGPSCPQTVDVWPAPSAVAILVDASQTMVTGLVDHDGDAMTPEITRWNMVSAALAEHVPTMVDDSLVGAWGFPAFAAEAPPAVGACTSEPVYAGIGSTAEQLLGFLPTSDATFMQGATPTASAIATAYAELSAQLPGGRRHIVLLTDGAPNCSVDAAPPELFDLVDYDAHEWAASVYADDMRVHVIGVDVPSGTTGGGVEGDAIADHRAELSALASSGGTAAIFADDATVLDLALDAIGDAVRSCRVVVPPPLAGLWYHVVIDGDRYYYDLGGSQLCPDNSGWYRVSLEGDGSEVIELCAGACESLRLHGSARVEEECVFPE